MVQKGFEISLVKQINLTCTEQAWNLAGMPVQKCGKQIQDVQSVQALKELCAEICCSTLLVPGDRHILILSDFLIQKVKLSEFQFWS